MKTNQTATVSARETVNEVSTFKALSDSHHHSAIEDSGNAMAKSPGFRFRSKPAWVLLAVAMAFASVIPGSLGQTWVGITPNWSTASNWDPDTVPNGRDVTVVFVDDTTAVVSNSGQSFTHLQVGNNADVTINGTLNILAPEDPFNPGMPSPLDPATIMVGGNSGLTVQFVSTPPVGPFGPEPNWLSVSVGENSSFGLDGAGKFENSFISKSGDGEFAFAGSAASIDVEEGILFTTQSAYVSSIGVQAGATLRGSGVQLLFSGTSITIDENGNLFSPTILSDFVAPSGQVLLYGTLNFRLGSLTDDDDGIAGVDWSRLDVTDGFVEFGIDSLLTLNFSPANNPDAGNSFWNSNHTWQIVNADNYSGTLAIQSPTYAAGEFSFDSGTGQLSFNAVPEPSAAMLLIGVAMAMLLKRRRQA